MNRLLPLVVALCLSPAWATASASDDCRAASDGGDYAAAVELCRLALESGGGPDDALALARAHRAQFELQPMLETYREGIRRFGTLDLYRAFAGDLLAFNLPDEAGRVLDDGMTRFPQDAALMELKAVSEASAGRDDEACAWIRRSWAAGADPVAWAENTLFGERAGTSPYRELLDPRRLAADLPTLTEERQTVRLRLLQSVMREEAAGAVADVLVAGASARIQWLGLADLALLGDRSVPYFSELLQSPDPSLRRKVLMTLWDLRLPSSLPLAEESRRRDEDPRNAALAEVLAAVLTSRLAGDPAALAAVSPDNPFLILAGAGPDRPSQGAACGLEAYWECMERQDIRDMLDLLESHRTVRRIDARLYGLPRDDFDDTQNLTIAERLFLRSWAGEQGLEWPTEGFIQYPREIRHTLRDIYRNTGMLPDCSGRLNDARGCDTASLLVREVEMKLYNDTGGDNEVNIVVNPYAQQNVIATSNAYSSSANETYYSSDWGKTWSHGATLGSSACDPVSFYNSQQTLYHSYLQSNGAIKVNYSSNHGQTWTACSATVESSSMDRQDLYIDTFTGDGGSWTASPCLNKLYVGYHNGGAQVMKSSTGTSSPYCGTWSARVSLASPGNSGTIGTAITSAIGKNSGSGNGTLLYLFSRYASSNQGIYVSTSTNCGSSLGTPSKIAALNNGGNFEWGIPSACSRMTYIYPSADADRQPLSAFRNNVYATWNDLSSACTAPGCNNNSTCNSDVFFATGVPNSRDNPTAWTWTVVNLTKTVLGTDSYTDEFYPALSVDQADGSIYLTYYRSASGANNNLAARQQQVHYVALRSINGGVGWQPVVQVTALPTNEYNSGADQAMQWGDYTWNDAVNGVLYPCWTDRREAADEDIWASKVCSEPSHWAERGASPTVPPTTAAPGANRVITVSWAPPDLYWGDGGEAAVNRKFQLYVDGSLYQDNIAATATGTTYTAADCTTSHTFRIRAVNSCGVTKDYANAAATATGCSSSPPPVNGTGPGAARFTKGPGSTLAVTYDAATCSAQKLIILYNTIGTWTGYAGCAQNNGGNGGSTTIDSTGQTATWYNLVWTSGTVAGHPGFAFNGTTNTARTWNVGTLCGMASDDKTKATCP